MRSVVFTDIDETLVRSAWRHAPAPDWEEAAVDKFGQPVSWQNSADRAFFQWLASAERVVAVTGRSIGAYQRVRLPFRGPAIVHHGAVVLTADGARDDGYRQTVERPLGASSAVLSDAASRLMTSDFVTQGRLRVTTHLLDNLHVEVCAKRTDSAEGLVADFIDEIHAEWRKLPGVRVHRNGNNLALLPGAVDKAVAVRWAQQALSREIGAFISVGAGDSDSDASFLAECDYVVLPRQSQIGGRLLNERYNDLT